MNREGSQTFGEDEAFYVPRFSRNSYDLRPGRGCHDACEERNQSSWKL